MEDRKMRKNVFTVCRGGGYLDIAGPQLRQQDTEVLLPTEYSNCTPKDAQHGDGVESNVLLPTFMNGRVQDVSEGQHGENSRTM